MNGTPETDDLQPGSQVLAKHMKAGNAGIQSALEEYNDGRLADVHALAYLDQISQHVRSMPLAVDAQPDSYTIPCQ